MELPPIMGESSTLGSAFMNLCVNAFDAMPKGGTLRIHTFAEARSVCLLVVDSGEGIPAEILHRVTEPFFTTKPPGRGTGLGLSICYAIVAEHNGRIEVDSAPGEGSVFRIILPRADETEDMT